MATPMPNKRSIKKVSLPDAIYDDLRDRILTGELAGGEVIRQELLAEEYGVSRMPVRDALKRLDAEGFVQIEANKGATVARHSLTEIGEIFDLRAMLESDLIRRAIPRMTDIHFYKCEQILAQMDRSLDQNNVSEWGRMNFIYHTALYEAADRSMTDDILERLLALSDRYVRMHLTLMDNRDLAKKDHYDMLLFAKAGDIEGASMLISTHINSARDQLLDLMAQNER